jgi:hypothetical protein
VDTLIEDLNRRIPPAPYDLRVSFRDSAVWLAGLSAVLALLLGGRGSILLAIFGNLLAGAIPPIAYLVLILPAVLSLASIPGLRRLRTSGWWLFFIATALDFLLALAALNIFSILFSGVFLYLLLQVHEYFWHRPYRLR